MLLDKVKTAFFDKYIEQGKFMESASQYGEPGYGTDRTTLVVLGTYWCECGNNPHAGKQGRDGGSNPYYVTQATGLHSIEDHYPRIWKQLEAQGVEFEWHDQWVVDTDHDKAYRTDPDMHGWQPSYVHNGDSLLTADDDITEWVLWAVNQPHKCIPTRIIKHQQIMDAGFVCIHDRLESGLHQGMDDEPDAYFIRECDKARSAGKQYEYLFMLDETSQFYITFSMWAREVTEDGES